MSDPLANLKIIPAPQVRDRIDMAGAIRLLGEAASPAAIAKITEALANADGVTRVIHLKTLHLGPEEILVAAKIAVEPTESAARVATVIDNAEVAIRAAEPWVTSLYLEPDIDRGVGAVEPASAAGEAAQE